jgi:hypothetical protein
MAEYITEIVMTFSRGYAQDSRDHNYDVKVISSQHVGAQTSFEYIKAEKIHCKDKIDVMREPTGIYLTKITYPKP